ncbi:MAG: DUF1636 domain-containing protein [Pseudomonadota bacterium]
MGSLKHTITVCLSCRGKCGKARPGHDLITRLREAMARAEGDLSAAFDVTGVACMAGCERPCTVAYHGPRKATYLFGDITPEADVEDLIAFAHQYAELPDGWCASVDRPGKLRRSTLARVPATAGEVA